MPYVKLIQSFADGRLGCVTIYKATNFHYYGYTTNEFYEDLDTNKISMVKLLNNTDRLTRMIDENINVLTHKIRFFKVKSYRYIYPLRKGALKGVKFKEKEYPNYDKGVEYFERGIKLQELIRCYIGCFIYDYDKKTIENFRLVLKQFDIKIDEIIKIIKANKTILKLIDKREKKLENIIEEIKNDLDE